MTWTYTLGTIATVEKDQIRLEVGDTDTNRQLLQDEEIAQAILVEGNFWLATARCAEMISRLMLSKVDVKLGRAMQVTYTLAAQQYKEMAKELRKKALGTHAPWVGGMSVSDKKTYEEDTDLIQPAFARSMLSNPRTGGYTSDTLSPTGGDQDV